MLASCHSVERISFSSHTLSGANKSRSFKSCFTLQFPALSTGSVALFDVWFPDLALPYHSATGELKKEPWISQESCSSIPALPAITYLRASNISMKTRLQRPLFCLGGQSQEQLLGEFLIPSEAFLKSLGLPRNMAGIASRFTGLRGSCLTQPLPRVTV